MTRIFFLGPPSHGTTVAPACCKHFSHGEFPHPEITSEGQTNRLYIAAYPARILDLRDFCT